MIPKELINVLSSSPDTMSGAIVFTGTRVPVQALVDTLSCGGTVEDFLTGYPNVGKNKAEEFVKWEQNLTRAVLGLEVAA